jgi:nucleoside-diphosphate-sugar epimerase
MTTPTVTILGAKGYIGGELARHLHASAWDVCTPDRLDYGWLSGRSQLGHVVYAIGLTADFRSRPFDTVVAHVELLRQTLQNAQYQSLTMLSSTRVYGTQADTREDAALTVQAQQPGDLYNLSKLMGESLCLHAASAGLSAGAPVRVLRLSNVVGQRPDRDLFIDQLIDEGLRTGKVCLQSALDSSKDYVHISDVLAAITTLLGTAHAGVFNIAGGVAVTHAQVTQALTQCFGWPINVAAGAPRQALPAIDITRAVHAFGYAPKPFASYFAQHLNHYHLSTAP